MCGIDQDKRQLYLLAGLGPGGIGNDLNRNCALHHLGIMPGSPKILSFLPNRRFRRHRPLYFRHVATLANKPAFPIKYVERMDTIIWLNWIQKTQ
jgi:hypothetical protein